MRAVDEDRAGLDVDLVLGQRRAADLALHVFQVNFYKIIHAKTNVLKENGETQ